MGTIRKALIAHCVQKDRTLEIFDLLNVETMRSKIMFRLTETGSRGEGLSEVKHFASAADVKLICWDVFTNQFDEWNDRKGYVQDNPQGSVFGHSLMFRKDTKYRQPFIMKIDNGVGEPLDNGTVNIISCSESLTILLPAFEARRIAQTVHDYIRDWELIMFRQRKDAQELEGSMGQHRTQGWVK